MRSTTLAIIAFLALSACGSAEDPPPAGGTPAGDPLLAGLSVVDPGMYGATPASDPRLLGGTGTTRLPARVDLSMHLPPVRNQTLNSCVGWSVGYNLKTVHEKIEEGWSVSTETNQFSPAFIYNQRSNKGPAVAGECADGAVQGCMSPLEALNILTNMGCCRWPNMPGFTQIGTTPPSAAAIAEADDYKAQSYRRFGTNNGLADTDIDDMRSWLHNEGTPITIGCGIYNGWQFYAGANNGVCLDVLGGSTQANGGHMMTIVGYDDHLPSTNTGSFYVVNSWGTNWGASGFMWVPYGELKKMLWYAWGVQDLANNTSAPPPPPPDSNNVITGAGTIFDGVGAAGSVGGTDPADWFKFTIGAGQTAKLELTGLSADIDMKLTDANEVRLASSSNGGTTNEEITYGFTQAGTYYLKVYPYLNATSAYSILLTVSAAQGNDVPAGATTISALNTNFGGDVGGSDARDWWQVTLPANTLATVILSGLTADLDLYVYRTSDLGGDYWLRSWNGGTSNEQLSFTSAGSAATYYLLVNPYAGSTSGYTIRVNGSSQADLVTTSWNVNYTEFVDRVDVTVLELKVQNIGNAGSGPFAVSVGVSNGTAPGATYWTGTAGWVDNVGLPAGFVDTWNSGMGTVSKGPLPAGNYFLLFQADSAFAVPEPDELNNFSFSSNAFITK